MNTRVVLVVAAAFLTMAAGLSWAGETQPVASAPGGLRHLEGEVRGVDLVGGTIEVEGEAGLFSRRILACPNAEVLMPSGRRAGLGAIREGDRIRAVYREVGGQNVAEEVRLLSSQEERAAGAAPARCPAAAPLMR